MGRASGPLVWRKRAMAEMWERTEVHRRNADSSAEPLVASHAEADLRVRMVLEVLGGRSADAVAHDWRVDPTLVHRWLRDFLVAGSSEITNRPDPDEAARRDRFMAAWAHELRTPVSVARGWLSLLDDGDVAPEEQADTVRRASDALERLSEQILDVELSSSASLGRLRVAREQVSVDALCRELPGCDGVRRGADEIVLADPRLLRRVLRDLWATAVREPAPDGVAVDVVAEGSWHEIRIVREGEPISATIMRALFDPFGANHDATGVTTGLFLTRALVVAHGGHLGAEGEERSTVLFARLPRGDEVDLEPSGLEATEKEGEQP